MINQVDLSGSREIWVRAYSANTLHVPFLTHQWHVNWKEILGTATEPFYFVINDDILAPFVKEEGTVFFSGGEEGSDYLDIIGPDDKKKSAWTELIPYCKNQHINRLVLRNIPENSPTLQFFQTIPSAVIEKEDTTPKMPLPGSWEAYVESLDRKDRHELERKTRKFEREHEGAVFTESADSAHDIEILLDLMEKDEDKRKFLTPAMKEFFRRTAATFADSISLLTVNIGGQHASATMAFKNHDGYYLYNSGFDKNNFPNAGFYAKAMSVRHAIEEGRKEYNFLQGHERYKYELGGKDFFVYKITLNL